MGSTTIDRVAPPPGGKKTRTGGPLMGGSGRFNKWDEGRDGLVKFLQDMKTILKFLVDDRIPDGPQALFLERFPDVEKNIDDVIKQLNEISSPEHETLKQLHKVELDLRALELKLKEFYDRIDHSPPHAGLKVGNTIMGSMSRVFPILEPVKEYKEIVEVRLKHGGDRGLTRLNLSGREIS